MEKQLINRLTNFLSQNELFKGMPATADQIFQAEKNLNVTLDEDYKEFISLFGGSYVGVPVYGFNNCEMISNESVVELTEDFRSSYGHDNRWPKISQRYVISISGNGDPIIIDKDGKIKIYFHDSNEEEVLADSFHELIEKNLHD